MPLIIYLNLVLQIEDIKCTTNIILSSFPLSGLRELICYFSAATQTVYKSGRLRHNDKMSC